MHQLGTQINPKTDNRPQYGGWAPGDYSNKCYKCNNYFIGDKRAIICADCAYGETVDGERVPFKLESEQWPG